MAPAKVSPKPMYLIHVFVSGTMIKDKDGGNRLIISRIFITSRIKATMLWTWIYMDLQSRQGYWVFICPLLREQISLHKLMAAYSHYATGGSWYSQRPGEAAAAAFLCLKNSITTLACRGIPCASHCKPACYISGLGAAPLWTTSRFLDLKVICQFTWIPKTWPSFQWKFV